MKKNAILVTALLLLIGSAYDTHGQTVTLGDATFDASSDQTGTKWFFPMLPDVTNTYTGFGDNDGLTKTERFFLGETVAGVKAVKRHIEGSSPAVPVEDWWLAAGTNDDLRVLKLVRGGVVLFEATANVTPPLLLPGTPTDGQTWELFGARMAVEWFALSFSGERFKVTETSGANVSCHHYHAGTGLTQTESGSSGWRRAQ